MVSLFARGLACGAETGGFVAARHAMGAGGRRDSVGFCVRAAGICDGENPGALAACCEEGVAHGEGGGSVVKTG